MIHKIVGMLIKLIDYGNLLGYEWSWKRGSNKLHESEYEELKNTLDVAENLKKRLIQIDNLNSKDLQNDGGEENDKQPQHR